MKKILASTSVRMNLHALSIRQKLKKHVNDCGGANQITDNAGLMALGITLVIVLIIWAVPYIRNTLLPQLGTQISSLFNYANNS